MNYYILLTAITVSIDSFFFGLSLATVKRKRILIVLTITLIVLIMCTLANYLTSVFSNYLTEKTVGLGGIILIGIGIFNLLRKDDDLKSDLSAFKQIIISGFAVGLDGSLANVSLALLGMNSFYVPLTIALMHGATIALGMLLCNTALKKLFTKLSFLPHVILVLLGLYKVIGIFI